MGSPTPVGYAELSAGVDAGRAAGDSASVGIESASGLVGEMISHNEPLLQPNSGVRWEVR